MEIILSKLLISFFITIPIISSSQTIEVHYHLGYDCGTEINGKEIRGGCVTNEQIKYTLNKTENYYEANHLKINKNIREYSNGKFGENLEKDSLTTYQFKKRIKSKDLDKLIMLISQGKDSSLEKKDTINYLEKKIISKWDRKTFEFSRMEICKLKRKAKKEFDLIIQDSVIQAISKYVEKENKGLMVSSVVEFLTIKFKYNGQEYSISQHNLGKVNVSWQISRDKEFFFVISPKVNKIISGFLPKKMRAKKKLKEFMQIDKLKYALEKK